MLIINLSGFQTKSIVVCYSHIFVQYACCKYFGWAKSHFTLTLIMENQEIKWSEIQIETLARTLKAIAHPSRVAIIGMLAGGKRLTVTEIYNALSADQSSVSHHLSIMRDRNVLGTTRDGKYIYYFLKSDIFLNLLDCVAGTSNDFQSYLAWGNQRSMPPAANGVTDH